MSFLFLRAMTIPHEVQRTLATLVFGGVLERFPKLQLVSAENDIGWLLHFLARADLTYHKLGSLKLSASSDAKLTLLPSEYFRRQVYATFIDDEVGVRNTDLFGIDKYVVQRLSALDGDLATLARICRPKLPRHR